MLVHSLGYVASLHPITVVLYIAPRCPSGVLTAAEPRGDLSGGGRMFDYLRRLATTGVAYTAAKRRLQGARGAARARSTRATSRPRTTGRPSSFSPHRCRGQHHHPARPDRGPPALLLPARRARRRSGRDRLRARFRPRRAVALPFADQIGELRGQPICFGSGSRSAAWCPTLEYMVTLSPRAKAYFAFTIGNVLAGDPVTGAAGRRLRPRAPRGCGGPARPAFSSAFWPSAAAVAAAPPLLL